ncbi:hypothetical protein ABW21_db0207413 [Orbilia brochopaga]|nr:hypothetical protein ABW21_db0207413 [Drechslerella brochopaga]
METSTTIPLPAELCYAILEHVPCRDLKAFSLCSKTCHELAVPLIFRAICFDTQSPVLAEGGALSHRLRYVRHLRFELPHGDLIPLPQMEISAFKITSYFMERFTQFTNFLITAPAFPLTSLALDFAGDAQLNINLFQTALSRLSQSGVSETLQQLSLSYASRATLILPLCRRFMVVDGNAASPYEAVLSRLPYALGPPLQPYTLCEGRDGRRRLPTPPPLTEASICIVRDLVPQAFYYHYFAACPTLRKLTIKAAQLFVPSPYAELYHSELPTFSVTHLHIQVAAYPPVGELNWLATHFPRLKNLIVENNKEHYYAQNDSVAVLQTAHDDILKMRELRTLAIPWPRLKKRFSGIAAHGRSYQQFTLNRLVRHLSRAELEPWVARWRGGGIPLQTIVFSGISQNEDYTEKSVMAECVVTSRDGGNGYTLSWSGDDVLEQHR